MTGTPPPAVWVFTALDGHAFGRRNGVFHLKVSGAATGGGLCIHDTLRSEQGGPPLHIHAAQDEWFFGDRGGVRDQRG